jgi:organic hydroperoxide reductase OsmC/OhrA
VNADASSSQGGHQEVVRRGRVSWLTHPPGGVARIGVESHAFGALPVSLPEGDPVPHEATPGELLAITHAMFLAAVLSEALALAGSPADEIVVEAACTLTGPAQDRELTAVDLYAEGRVPGLDATAFRKAVVAARQRSLRSAGAREDIPGELQAVLDPSA